MALFREWLEVKIYLTVMAWQAHVCSLFGHDYWQGAICRRCTHISEAFKYQLQQHRREPVFKFWPYYGVNVLRTPRSIFLNNNLS